MTQLLTGMTAIITGSTRGIGHATAQLFIEHGVNVVNTSRDQKEVDEVVKRFVAASGSHVAKYLELAIQFEERRPTLEVARR